LEQLLNKRFLEQNSTEISGADKRTEQRFLEQSLDKRTEQKFLEQILDKGTKQKFLEQIFGQEKAEISGADFRKKNFLSKESEALL
jgi:hypothetical protein